MKFNYLYGLCCLVFVAVLINACQHEEIIVDDTEVPPEDTLYNYLKHIPETSHRSGDPQAGYDYLVNGDYVSSGIPLAAAGSIVYDEENVLNRTGDNATLPPNFTAVNARNGIKVAAPNCLSCHGQTINGQYVVGLGNATFDYTVDQSATVALADGLLNLLYGQDSPEWEAYKPFRDASLAIGPHVITEVRGVNPADQLFAVLSAHRDPYSLEWIEDPQFNVEGAVVPTDIPAWWLMKKKNALYYTALGKEDYARSMMASGLLTMQDSTEARHIDNHFPDVVAYLKSIEPPAYPESVDLALAEMGKLLYADNCQVCHGSYGDNESYPNMVVAHELIGTDRALADIYFERPEFVNWFNDSWFTLDGKGSYFDPEHGYIAPPLDGIWATAPYLHNGSVPTVYDLLNSSERPTYWQRTFGTDMADYDSQKMGWIHTRPASKESTEVYDTTLPAYGNEGHTFGDHLNDEERYAVIEYLKTI